MQVQYLLILQNIYKTERSASRVLLWRRDAVMSVNRHSSMIVSLRSGRARAQGPHLLNLFPQQLLPQLASLFLWRFDLQLEQTSQPISLDH
jgi:hypothetical protein